jgi:hypothetical protein
VWPDVISLREFARGEADSPGSGQATSGLRPKKRKSGAIRVAVRTFMGETMDMAVQEVRGDLSADEVLKAQHELYSELEFDPARSYSWDATEGNVATTMTGGGPKV